MLSTEICRSCLMCILVLFIHVDEMEDPQCEVLHLYNLCCFIRGYNTWSVTLVVAKLALGSVKWTISNLNVGSEVHSTRRSTRSRSLKSTSILYRSLITISHISLAIENTRCKNILRILESWIQGSFPKGPRGNGVPTPPERVGTAFPHLQRKVEKSCQK